MALLQIYLSKVTKRPGFLPVHEKRHCGLMLYKMPVDFWDKNDNSQTGNTHRSVSRPQFVNVFCAVSFLLFLG